MPPSLQKHYLIRDANDHVLAVHHVFDSAEACFHSIKKTGCYNAILTLFVVGTDGLGIVVQDSLLFTFLKDEQLFINHHAPN